MNEWNSLECPSCGYGEAIHTVWSEDNHEINCTKCDLIERDNEDNCEECGGE
jgi:primosomal protein N'